MKKSILRFVLALAVVTITFTSYSTVEASNPQSETPNPIYLIQAKSTSGPGIGAW